MLCLIEGVPTFADLKSESSNLKSEAEGISRQLRAWADSLQNSGVTGQRYLTDKSRRESGRERDRKQFLADLEEIRKGSKKA